MDSSVHGACGEGCTEQQGAGVRGRRLGTVLDRMVWTRISVQISGGGAFQSGRTRRAATGSDVGV